MLWTLCGGVLEILGLVVAAYGLLLTWRGVAEGHTFIPKRRNRSYTGTASMTLPALTGTAYGYVTDPDETVDEKLARVHAVLAAFDQRIGREVNEREASLDQLREEVRDERTREHGHRNADARADTRLAAVGLSLAACGSILQLIGAFS